MPSSRRRASGSAPINSTGWRSTKSKVDGCTDMNQDGNDKTIWRRAWTMTARGGSDSYGKRRISTANSGAEHSTGYFQEHSNPSRCLPCVPWKTPRPKLIQFIWTQIRYILKSVMKLTSRIFHNAAAHPPARTDPSPRRTHDSSIASPRHQTLVVGPIQVATLLVLTLAPNCPRGFRRSVQHCVQRFGRGLEPQRFSGAEFSLAATSSSSHCV